MSPVQPNPNERALAVFDAFLRYAREGRAITNTSARPTAPPTQQTAAAQPEAMAQQQAPTSTVESPVAIEEDPPIEERTDPNIAAASTSSAEEFEEIPTRESHLSAAMASNTSPQSESMWDEPTRERPDVVRELRSAPPPPDPSSFHRIPETIAAEKSIIVDDDVANTEPVRGDELRSVRAESMRVETFLSEMTVLIKYGHAGQVPREIDRWLRANADDLTAQLRVADFERSRVDASAGLDRLFWIASRALDRGDRDVAMRVLDIVTQEAPNDLRRDALEDRVGAR